MEMLKRWKGDAHEKPAQKRISFSRLACSWPEEMQAPLQKGQKGGHQVKRPAPIKKINITLNLKDVKEILKGYSEDIL